MSGTLTEVKMPRHNPAAKFVRQPDHIGRLVRDVFSHLTAELNGRLDGVHTGVTPAQNRVLVLIEPDGSRPAVLASRAEMTRQSMHEMLVSMSHAGLIELRPDPHDRRAKLAVLTPAGWEAEREGLRAVLALHKHWQATIGAPKMHNLMSLLRELLDRLAQEPDPPTDASATP